MYRAFNITYKAMLIGIFPAVVFIMSYINMKLNLNPLLYDEVKESVNDFPLSEFSFSSQCDEEQYSPFLYTFPGSRGGCSCINIKRLRVEQTHQGEVIPDKCDKNQTINGCQELKAISGMKLFNWKNGSFCSKYYNHDEKDLYGYFYYLNNSVLENESCENGYKNCGKLDDFGNILCLPENESCPINDIISSDIERPDLIADNYSYINVEGKLIYFTNQKVDKQVITKLKAGEKRACNYRSFQYTDYPQYILDKNFDKYGCRYLINGKIFQERENIIDNTTKKELYEYSDVGIFTDEKYNNEWHNFPFYSLNEEIYLYPKTYIGFNKKCMLQNGGLKLDTLFPNGEDVKNVNSEKMMKYNNLISWFSLFGFVLEVSMCSLLRLDSDESILFIISWAIFNCACYIVMATPVYLNYKKLVSLKTLPLCGGQILNEKIKAFNHMNSTLKVTTIIQIIALNLQIGFNILFVILRFKCQYKGSDNTFVYRNVIYNKNKNIPEGDVEVEMEHNNNNNDNYSNNNNNDNEYS